MRVRNANLGYQLQEYHLMFTSLCTTVCKSCLQSSMGFSAFAFTCHLHTWHTEHSLITNSLIIFVMTPFQHTNKSLNPCGLLGTKFQINPQDFKFQKADHGLKKGQAPMSDDRHSHNDKQLQINPFHDFKKHFLIYWQMLRSD